MSAANLTMSVDAFLAMERSASVRHEFIDGEVRQMPGGTIRHGLIIANLLFAIRTALRITGEDFEVLTSDMRVKTPDGLYTYPDLSVASESAAYEGDDDLSVEPIGLFEVLSPSTEAYDRGEKFRHYESIATLRFYAIVSQDRAQVELFERSDVGAKWLLSRYESIDSVLKLDAVGVEIGLGEVYRRIDFASQK